MIQHPGLPRLTAEHRVTSPETRDYNCIAWAAGDVEHWWEPGRYWPIPASADDYGIHALEAVYRELGYVDCGTDDSLEPGFEKVVLYGSGLFYTHAARQLPTGEWTSK